jgi:hypothetical protein
MDFGIAVIARGRKGKKIAKIVGTAKLETENPKALTALRAQRSQKNRRGLLRGNPWTSAGGGPDGHFVQVSADGAEFHVALEGVVGLAVLFAQDFKLLHFAIVFFRGGEKLDDAGFEKLVSVCGGVLQFNAPGT